MSDEKWMVVQTNDGWEVGFFFGSDWCKEPGDGWVDYAAAKAHAARLNAAQHAGEGE